MASQTFTATLKTYVGSKTISNVAQQGCCVSSTYPSNITRKGLITFTGLSALAGKTITQIDFQNTFSSAGRNAKKKLVFTSEGDAAGSFTPSVNCYNNNVDTTTFPSGTTLYTAVINAINGNGTVNLVLNNGETDDDYGSSSLSYSENYLQISSSKLIITYSDVTSYTYTINFNGNGNTGGSLPATITKSGTSTSVVMGDISSSVPTRTGYTFRGWSASSSYSNKRIAFSTAAGGGADANGVSAVQTGSNWTYANYCSYTGGSTSSRTLTLYAQWESLKYTISYNENAQGGGTVSNVPSSQTKTYGVALTLQSTTPTHSQVPITGYTVYFDYQGSSGVASLQSTRIAEYAFFKWNTAPDGSGTSYSPGASYSTNANLTLYAQWVSTIYNYSIELPTPADRTGYIFTGWYTAPSGGTKVGDAGNTYLVETNGITLYAQWQEEGDPIAIIKRYKSSSSYENVKVWYRDSTSKWIPIQKVWRYNGSEWIQVSITDYVINNKN